MESPRSAKRRKLSPQASTPASTKPAPPAPRASARKTALTPAQEPPVSVPVPATNDATTTRTTTPRTRKSLPQSALEVAVDVYDDIDGAHAAAPVLPRSGKGSARKPASAKRGGAAAASTPTVARSNSTKAKKKAIDTEKSQISSAASHKGLTSLKARLDAKIAAAAAARKKTEDEAKQKVQDVQDEVGTVPEPSGAYEADDVNSQHEILPLANQQEEEAQEEEEEGEEGQTGQPVAPVKRKPGRPRKLNKSSPPPPPPSEALEMTDFEKEQYEKTAKRVAAKERSAQIAREKMEALARGEKVNQGRRGRRSRVDREATGDASDLGSGKKRAAKKTAKTNTADDEVPEDTACNICGKLNSPKHNMIVMCDGCDNAYHQKCHQPHISPKVLKDDTSEWFCAECMFRKKVTVTATATALPKPSRPAQSLRQQEELEDESNIDVALPGILPPSTKKAVQKRASTSAQRPRALSPMVLDLPDEHVPQRTPAKATTPAKALPKPPPQSVLKPRPSASLNLAVDSDHLTRIQQTVLEQLTNRRPNSLVGLSTETAQIASLIDQTISHGESNSLLVIGARGSGKSAVVNSILSTHKKQQPDAFHVVRLNGFIHTDDKLALREIWRQLGREMQTEDIDVAGSKSYADALTTLLALLSHPTELGQDVNGAEGELKSMSVVFVLDEFDLFTTHPRQTLLYNLFDIAQSRKAPILVLGLTTRFDVAEQLEKRVKSRFSHRFVHLGLAKNLEMFRDICLGCLVPTGVSGIPSINGNLTEDENDSNSLTTWKAILADFFATPVMDAHLRKIYYTTKSPPHFQSSLLPLVTTLPIPSEPSQIPSETLLAHLSDAKALSSTFPPDSKIHLLHSLSTLQLSLLISAARLTIIHDTETVSFALAYEEYKTLASRARIASSSAVIGGVVATGVGRVFGKEVARGAWEGLVGLELVMGEGGVGSKGDGAGWRVDILLEEIRESGVEMGVVMGRWCREI